MSSLLNHLKDQFSGGLGDWKIAMNHEVVYQPARFELAFTSTIRFLDWTVIVAFDGDFSYISTKTTLFTLNSVTVHTFTTADFSLLKSEFFFESKI